MIWLVMVRAHAFDVEVHGVDGPGTVGCAVFTSEEGFPSDHRRAAALAQVPASEARDGVVTCRFPEITAGRVAVSVRHDRNANGKLDTTIVGFPKEPFGFSRNAALRPFGPPRFEDAVTDVTSPLRVELRSK